MIKKIFVIAGESSGDMLGSKLINEFKTISNLDISHQFIFSGVGGQQMQHEGFKSIFPMEDLAVMGILEVLPHLPKLINRINFTVKKIIEFQPDFIITIDSPDFCFRVIKKLRKHKIFQNTKKIHLIAPSVWAYRENRAQKISKLYDLLLAILPFEPPYFEKYGLKTKFIGHPIINDILKNNIDEKQIVEIRKTYHINENDKIILLTPGSRIGEVKKIFPEFIGAVNQLKNSIKNLKIIIITVKKTHQLVEKLSKQIDAPVIIMDSNDKKIAYSIANYAIAKSGTNAVEISLYKIPLVIAYKINFLTHQIIKRMVKIKYANLLNIVLNREIIPELLQNDCNSKKIHDMIFNLINNDDLSRQQINETQKALKILGLGTIDNPMKIAIKEILNL